MSRCLLHRKGRNEEENHAQIGGSNVVEVEGCDGRAIRRPEVVESFA